MKKYLLLATIVTIVAIGGMVAHSTEAASVREGWLEDYGHGITGWAYDNGKPLTVVITLEDVNNPSATYTVTLNSQTQQTSQYVFNYRFDVVSYLTSKYKINSFPAAIGFQLETPLIVPSGTYKIKSATFNGRKFNLTSTMKNSFYISSPIVPPTVPQPQAISEGWLETANEMAITGWAYDNAKAVTISVTLENTKTGNLQTVSGAPSLYRSDVANYIAGKNGGTAPSNYLLEFKISPSNLPAGTYHVKYATFNGLPFKIGGPANNNFTVGIDHKVRLTSPNGGENWIMGTQKTISWVDANPTNDYNQTYTLWLTRADGGAYGEIATVSNAKQFIWNVGSLSNGSAVTAGSQYYIQIQKQYVEGSGTYDATDNAFSITTQSITMPDYQVTGVSYSPGYVYPNQPVTVTAYVQNSGTMGSLHPDISFSYTNGPTNSSNSSGTCNQLSFLNPGETCTFIMTLYYNSVGSKSVTVGANTNSSNIIQESNYNNNTNTATFYVYPYQY